MRAVIRWSLLSVVVPAIGAGAQASGTGVSGNITMSLQPPVMGTMAPARSTLSGTVSFVNGKGRIDIASASGPGIDYRAGDYVLLPDSARAIYIRPSTKEFWDMDSPFLNPYAALAGNTQITASGGNVTMERTGDGESIGAFATKKFRINLEYTVNAGTTAIPAGITIDITVARAPVKFAGVPVAGAQTFGIATPPAVTSRVAGYLAEMAAEGVVVRANSAAWFSVSGTTMNTLVTTDITGLKVANVDPATLSMPAGFKAGS
ncbi:MAG TPA: hypothetical protein VE967_13415 [Gemmatimonadaceae bacterium]|nr:hypothetical protein [Gemmatimonadaceae bacterium]